VVLSIDLPEKSGLESLPADAQSRVGNWDRHGDGADSEREMVQSLEAGADDYVTRRFQFRELTARVADARKRILQHPSRSSGAAIAPPAAHSPSRVGFREKSSDS